MTVRARGGGLFADDEELGKKSDDHQPSKMGKWNVRTRPGGWRKRRIAGVILGCVALYFFIVNIPRDMGPVNARIRSNRPVYGKTKGGRAIPKSEYNFERPGVYPPEIDDDTPVAPATRGRIEDNDASPTTQKDLSYDGPVRFYKLASTLHQIASIVDYRPGNRHVLFTASDLGAAASLIPMACEMASWKRNTVHFAIMGRDNIPIPQIVEMNGAGGTQCPIYWHDGRPDHAEESTGPRMQLAVSGAMGHIVSFMHPQAVITTDAEHENVFFTSAMSRAVRAHALTHIEIPKARPEKLGWLARLDAGSLKAWHSAGVDVLVQAPLQSAGSLIRLLRSLEAADYSGFTPPRLTIELPHKIDQATQNFLAQFRWPPYQYLRNPTAPDELITRRRISEQHVTSDDASLRFVESFYPSSPRGPNVLLLSPQAELSPAFFHYLKLHLLEFKHSLESSDDYNNLFGISLETPTMYLNGTTKFVPPLSYADKEDDGTYNPFRWQAPDSNAALYFSDKWIEFHSFLTKRRTATLHPRTADHHATRPKLVTQRQPAWVEYALDIMRTRGYSLHYPGIFSHNKGRVESPSKSLVIVHNELYQQPEEFAASSARNLRKRDVEEEPESSTDSVLTVTADPTDYLSAHHPSQDESQEINDEQPLLRTLLPLLPALELTSVTTSLGQPDVQPAKLPLPDLARLPLLVYTGETVSSADLRAYARNTRVGYRHVAGGCSDKAANVDEIQLGSAEDLFCLDDETSIEASRSTSETDSLHPIPGAVTSHGEDIVPIADRVADTVVKTAKNLAAAGVAAVAGSQQNSDTSPSRAERPVLEGQAASSDDDRDAAPPAADIPKHPAHVSFEDEMAARDAARADRLTDRARNQDGKQKQGAAVFKLRTATEDDDEEAVARQGPIEVAPSKTKSHVGPADPNAPVPKFRGLGAAEHVAAVDNPAKYAETARAGFLKKAADAGADALANVRDKAKVINDDPTADTDAQEPANLPVNVASSAMDDDEEEPGAVTPPAPPAPTKTRLGPGDPNDPVPKLRGKGAAEHVAAAEDPAKYAETARAGFLKKLGKGGDWAKEDASVDEGEATQKAEAEDRASAL